jgi:hypothetical protein
MGNIAKLQAGRKTMLTETANGNNLANWPFFVILDSVEVFGFI